MTLTQFITDSDVRNAIDNAFPKPNKNVNEEIKYEPKTKHYSIIGQAFDYIARFWVERQSDTVSKKEWTASYGLDIVKQQIPSHAQNCEQAYENAVDEYDKYIKAGKFNQETAKASIDLARLTSAYRGQLRPLNYIGEYDDGDIEDCLNLYDGLDKSNCLSCSDSVLNPSFEEISKLVGNADADIIIDNKLIDIKTTKNGSFKIDYWRQLVGYAILVDLYNELHEDDNPYPDLNTLCIYYSRHSVLKEINADVVYDNPEYEEFRAWFVDKALDEYSSLSKKDKSKLCEKFCEPYDYSDYHI